MEIAVFVNKATETSIPLEVAEKVHLREDIHVTVYSFFETSSVDTSCNLISLDAGSQTDFRAYLRLYRRLKRDQPDVFHVHPNATGSIARVVAKIARVSRLVTTEHSVHSEYSILKNIVNGGTNWLNDVVVCNSSVTLNSFPKWERDLLNLLRTDVEVIHNGVDINRIEDADPPNTELPDGFLICTVGRLVPGKNQSALIEAVARLREEHPDVQLVIVGDGRLRDKLENLAIRRGISDSVNFTGQVARDEVYSILKVVDLFVFPSQYEGFGVAAAEAMAAGKPVIANDIEVLQEIIDNAGCLLNAADAEQIEKAVRDLYLDPKRRTRLGNKASKRIKHRFTLDKTVQNYIALYQELVNRYD